MQAASPAPKETAAKDQKKDDGIQGVFVIRNRKAEFVPVTTGVTGTTDIEVLEGLREGDEVITGSYKVLRTLRPGKGVKIDNSAPKKEDETITFSGLARPYARPVRSQQCMELNGRQETPTV